MGSPRSCREKGGEELIRRALFLAWFVWSICVLWGEATDSNPWRPVVLVGGPFAVYQFALWCWEGRRR